MAFEEYMEDPEDPQEGPHEIDEEEREALRQDLVDVRTLKTVLGSRGIRGVVVWCPDCEDDHFLGWDLLAGNLQQILESGEPPVHEPAWQPDPDEYVTWDYARGFLDGYETYPEERSDEDTCGYCGNRLPEGGYDWAYCPSCGKDLAPINLIFELRKRGWAQDRIAELMEQAGFEPPLLDPDAEEAFSAKLGTERPSQKDKQEDQPES
jgi:hypothetical protein